MKAHAQPGLLQAISGHCRGPSIAVFSLGVEIFLWTTLAQEIPIQLIKIL